MRAFFRTIHLLLLLSLILSQHLYGQIRWDDNQIVKPGQHIKFGKMSPCITILVQDKSGEGIVRHFFRQESEPFSVFARRADFYMFYNTRARASDIEVFVAAGTKKSFDFEFAGYRELVDFFHKNKFKNVSFMKAPDWATYGELERLSDGTVRYIAGDDNGRAESRSFEEWKGTKSCESMFSRLGDQAQ